ncbi:imelysin family protein [Sediminicola arcticus]|jgi:predicted lipoprotein|uniref:Imelysin family protein n=1 Tax=Sediminicola arcticus TaxID=1574308 RepID=A0ABV2SSK6_9FLAO
MKKVVLITLCVVLFWACSSDGTDDIQKSNPTEVSFDRGAMLSNWADNIIIPSYEAFSVEMTNLNVAFVQFKEDRSAANLEFFRASWLDTYKMWQRVSMFEIGPAESAGLRLNMNIYPTNTQKIDDYLVSGNYDLSLSSNRDAKGFPALDYLINGLGETDTDIVARFATSDENGLLSYTEAVLLDMTTLSNSVLEGWKNGYRDVFVSNDGASSTASVDRYVNDYIFYFEKFLRAGKMGIPLGVFSGSTLPKNLEAYYKSDVSKELFLEGLAAVQDFFNGKYFGSTTTGESLASYLDVLNSVKDGEDLNAVINAQFNIAREAVTGLSSFRIEIENNNPPTLMLSAYDEVQRAVPLLKVDMVSAMSISVDFVDADGD